MYRDFLQIVPSREIHAYSRNGVWFSIIQAASVSIDRNYTIDVYFLFNSNHVLKFFNIHFCIFN